MFPRNSKTLVYLIVFLGSFLLLFISPHLFSPLKFSVMSLTAWPKKIVSVPVNELKKLVFYHRTFDEYLRLRQELRTMRARLTGFEEVLRENTRLEGLLEFKRQLIYASVAANVTGRDPSNWNSTMILDRGLADGVDVGMPVVNAMGVVGKVAEVSDHNAKVILLTDQAFSVPALIKRSREVGLVSGTLQGKCRLRYLSRNADIQEGDLIITSKLSSTFPEGLIVGEVVEVTVDPNAMTTHCLIEPAVNLSQLEEVLIIQQR